MEIKIQALRYQRKNDVLLKDITCTLKAGRVTSILGKSGEGKTLLLKLLNARLLPTEGTIIMGHSAITKESKELGNIRRHIGFMSVDSVSHFTKKTVKQELLFCLAKYPFEGNTFDRVQEVLQLVEIPLDLIHQKIELLSFPIKKKLALACACISNPSVLLLDEPMLGLTSLDQKHFIKMLYTLSRKEKMVIILATQNVELALKVSDEILLLGKGKIRSSGDKYTVLKEASTLHKYGLKVPNTLKFSNLVYREKKVKIGCRDEINDLMKDIFRYVK